MASLASRSGLGLASSCASFSSSSKIGRSKLSRKAGGIFRENILKDFNQEQSRHDLPQTIARFARKRTGRFLTRSTKTTAYTAGGNSSKPSRSSILNVSSGLLGGGGALGLAGAGRAGAAGAGATGAAGRVATCGTAAGATG